MILFPRKKDQMLALEKELSLFLHCMLLCQHNDRSQTQGLKVAAFRTICCLND